MRKTLILTMIILLVVVVAVMMLGSLKIGGFEILGIGRLNEENKKLDDSIQKLSALSTTGYKKALTEVSESAKQYKTAKQSYEELAMVSSDGTVSAANQLQKYEIEYLWTRIGSHATKENVVLKMDVAANTSSSATGFFDLNFTVTGSYVAITDFIYDIENDSSLGFKIENFKMTSGSATFKCTNIAINIDKSALSTTDSDNGENTENIESEDSNSTNTTNTNTNTTNSTSDSNTTNTTSGSNTVTDMTSTNSSRTMN